MPSRLSLIKADPIALTKPNLERDTSLKTRKYDVKSGFSVVSTFAPTKPELRFRSDCGGTSRLLSIRLFPNFPKNVKIISFKFLLI